MNDAKAPFFVGYLGIPKGLKVFLLFISIMLLSGFATSALLIGATQDDPGKAGFRFDFGRQTVTGIIQDKPYPLIYVTKGNERIKTGQTLMLSGSGKRGAMKAVKKRTGELAEVTGIILRRGDIDMLQLVGGKKGFKPLSEAAEIPASVPLGRWKIQGEICDGKCIAGAMNPGRGLAHKACANLCLEGDIPPVFVSTQPIEGSEFLLVGDANGRPLRRQLYDYVGQFVEIEANIERRGDLLVVLVDPANVSVVK
ncbi:MAG: hypothetical protein ABJL18_00795 [Hyphomicrobiales bacterium]